MNLFLTGLIIQILAFHIYDAFEFLISKKNKYNFINCQTASNLFSPLWPCLSTFTCPLSTQPHSPSLRSHKKKEKINYLSIIFLSLSKNYNTFLGSNYFFNTFHVKKYLIYLLSINILINLLIIIIYMIL